MQVMGALLPSPPKYLECYRERERADYILLLIQSYLRIYPAKFILVEVEGVEPIKLTIQGATFSKFRDKEIIFGCRC